MRNMHNSSATIKVKFGFIFCPNSILSIKKNVKAQCMVILLIMSKVSYVRATPFDWTITLKTCLNNLNAQPYIHDLNHIEQSQFTIIQSRSVSSAATLRCPTTLKTFYIICSRIFYYPLCLMIMSWAFCLAHRKS